MLIRSVNKKHSGINRRVEECNIQLNIVLAFEQKESFLKLIKFT
jgi:hypothetical protein